MFGLSIGKLALLAVVVLIVWYGFKYMQRVETVRRTVRRGMDAKRKPRVDRGAAVAAEDLVKCERCGAYVAAHSTAACGRADCPWGR